MRLLPARSVTLSLTMISYVPLGKADWLTCERSMIAVLFVAS